MTDIVAVCVIALVLGAAIAYIVRQKRAGVKCIGCSAAGGCAGKAGAAQAGCSCGCASVERMLADVEKAMG